MGAVPHGTQWTNPGHGKCFTFGAEPLRHHHLRISFCAKQSLWRFSASQKLCQSHIKAHEEYGIPYDQRHQPYTDGCIPEHHQLCSPRALLDPPKQGNSVCLQSIHPPCDAPPPSVHWVPAATGRPQAAPKCPSLGSSLASAFHPCSAIIPVMPSPPRCPSCSDGMRAGKALGWSSSCSHLY